MKHKKLFRNIFLMGMASLLFLISSCNTSGNTPNNNPEDKTQPVTITKFTIGKQEFDVSTNKDITLPSGVESFVATDIKSVKGKVKGEGAEVTLEVDKINPLTVNATEQGTFFTLSTKATKDYKAGSIKLKAIKASSSTTTTFRVNFSVAPSDAATITATVAGKTISTGDPVAENAEVVFALTNVKTGFTVKGWTGSTNLTTTSDRLGATLQVREETTITVTLEREIQGSDVTVTYEVEAGADGQKHGSLGMINSKFQPVQSGGTVKVGETLRLAGEAEAGYVVEEWKINNVKQDGKTSLNLTVKVQQEHVTQGLRITVKYKSKPQTQPETVALTYNVKEGSTEHGTLTAKIKDATENLSAGTANVTKGAMVVFTAEPKTDTSGGGKEYKVDKWYVGGNVVSDQDGNTTFEKKIDEAVTVEVSFVEES